MFLRNVGLRPKYYTTQQFNNCRVHSEVSWVTVGSGERGDQEIGNPLPVHLFRK
jgi:hypothetical protein